MHLDPEKVKLLNELAAETRIAKSVLMREAIDKARASIQDFLALLRAPHRDALVKLYIVSTVTNPISSPERLLKSAARHSPIAPRVLMVMTWNGYM